MRRALPIAACVVAGAAAIGMKLHYSRATAEGLEWILAPTVALVSALTGIAFFRESGVGYMNNELRFSIVPACAGVNFWVVSFLSIAYALVKDELRAGRAIAKLGAAALAAYGATVLANALRIALALELRAHDVHLADGASAHRTLGILVYVPALFAVFELASRAGAREERRHA